MHRGRELRGSAQLTSRPASLAAVILAALAPAAIAHTQNGSLGADPGATDYYQVTCTDDGSGVPASIVVDIVNQSPGSALPVSALVNKGAVAANTSDTAGGDGSGSPFVSINGGVGVYNLFVTKPATGAVSYTLTFHCMTGVDGSGEHTGTTLVFKQNQ